MDGSTSYTITDLEPGTTYSVRVTATNTAGSNESDTMSVQTGEHVIDLHLNLRLYNISTIMYAMISPIDRAIIAT